jgi:hypothetical protein
MNELLLAGRSFDDTNAGLLNMVRRYRPSSAESHNSSVLVSGKQKQEKSMFRYYHTAIFFSIAGAGGR